MESVAPSLVTLTRPDEIPGLSCFWDFPADSDRFPAAQGAPCVLESQSGMLTVRREPDAPFGGSFLALEEGQWLRIPRAKAEALDYGGPRSAHTLVAWIERGRKSNRECEFVAGMWNETQRGRQYGLFLNISVWRQHDQVCGHLSSTGGPTPGFRYCVDGPVGATPVPEKTWTVVAMSYDGLNGYAWLDGALDVRPGLNPYPLAGGLFSGGDDGSDFTVGAVDRGGSIGNFFTGKIAGLAAYHRALTPGEIFALSRLKAGSSASVTRQGSTVT